MSRITTPPSQGVGQHAEDANNNSYNRSGIMKRWSRVDLLRTPTGLTNRAVNKLRLLPLNSVESHAFNGEYVRSRSRQLWNRNLVLRHLFVEHYLSLSKFPFLAPKPVIILIRFLYFVHIASMPNLVRLTL